ncbi:hypothetical protein MSAN_02465100 [Mycena sanguinolenta]|uniref:Glycosyltransferase family 69 protein n=1 Tax=Mycena sanguinolenta TaxID=230812 RepID=A0A8H6WX69_9AGAR|nr:hypothetical protein MSAN_02465100 [Mycena sanguinolenta]
MQDGWRRHISYASIRPRIVRSIAWLITLSKRPSTSRVAYPVFWVFEVALSLLVRTAWFTLPVYLFHYVYRYYWAYWTSYFPPDAGLFEPAWPKSRIRLVILMATIPTWGLCMALGVVLWAVLKVLVMHAMQSSRRKHGREDGVSTPSKRTRARRSRMATLLRTNYLSMVCFVVSVSMALSGVYMFETYEYPGDHRYKGEIETALREPRDSGYFNGTKVFVAAMFNNNIEIMPYWIKEITKVIYYLGSDNVFISIVEGNSWDGTAEILDEWNGTLDQLGVPHLIRTRDKTIPRPADMSTSNPRIEFLSATRNLALEPLIERGGYDIVLFSNDVFIEADSIVELLKTKDGEWDMVCGLDLMRWGLYDAWVVRDRLGRLVSSLWPYFLEDAGMQAVMEEEPAPVLTCWNGIVAFRADPLLPISLRKPGPYPQSASLTPAQTPPIKFRRSGDKECFSSESFNLPYDLRRQFDMDRIYLNPRVINSYEWKYYVWFKLGMGVSMVKAKMVIGDTKRVWVWDGGDCHPW